MFVCRVVVGVPVFVLACGFECVWVCGVGVGGCTCVLSVCVNECEWVGWIRI